MSETDTAARIAEPFPRAAMSCPAPNRGQTPDMAERAETAPSK
jgi:hypothetical protein